MKNTQQIAYENRVWKEWAIEEGEETERLRAKGMNVEAIDPAWTIYKAEKDQAKRYTH